MSFALGAGGFFIMASVITRAQKKSVLQLRIGRLGCEPAFALLRHALPRNLFWPLPFELHG